MLSTSVSFQNKFQSKWKRMLRGWYFLHAFQMLFMGTLTDIFLKHMNLLMTDALKPCGYCAYILSALFKTSLSEKFRAEVFKSPFKTRTWKVKEKKKEIWPWIAKELPWIPLPQAWYPKIILPLDLSFPHKNEASFLGASERSCIYNCALKA